MKLPAPGGKGASFQVGRNKASPWKMMKLPGWEGGIFLVGREEAFQWEERKFPGGKAVSFPVGMDEDTWRNVMKRVGDN